LLLHRRTAARTAASDCSGLGSFGTNAVEEDGGRLVGRVLRDELAAERALEDGAAKRGAAALDERAVASGPADLGPRPFDESSNPGHKCGYEIAAISGMASDDRVSDRIARLCCPKNANLCHVGLL